MDLAIHPALYEADVLVCGDVDLLSIVIQPRIDVTISN